MNLGRLSEKIKEINIPIKTISEKIGISRQSFYEKMRGKTEFRASEIDKLCTILRLTPDEKTYIFFTEEVDENVNT